MREFEASFPDLKGQAPLRPEICEWSASVVPELFLTSKVRLHCDTKKAALPTDASTAFS